MRKDFYKIFYLNFFFSVVLLNAFIHIQTCIYVLYMCIYIYIHQFKKIILLKKEEFARKYMYILYSAMCMKFDFLKKHFG